ncbi:MAG TPA: hypothetical protein VE396_08535 [Xanthobacteraceae bacterium]|nr:hypothetical protein [Xanthobacteraceae bacterium]
MRSTLALKLPALALVVYAGFACTASAEDAAAPAPVTAPQNPLPGTKPSDAQQTPAPDAAKDLQHDLQSCLGETGDFVTHGNAFTYVIGIENKCAKRLKCTIDAYITGAKGPVSVHTVMTLDAKAKKSYTAKVKTSGGTAEVSRDCKAF